MAITPVNQDFVIKNGAVVLGTKVVTSSTGQTGALQVNGGAAIARNLIVGETAEVFGNGTFHGTVTAFSGLAVDGPVQLNNTLNVSNSATLQDLYVQGGLTVSGGNSFTGNQEFLGTATFYNNLIVSGTNATILGGTLSVDGKVTLNDLTTATTAPDGSLVVLGGQYIGNNLIVASTLSTTSTFIDNAVYVSGGIGVEGNLVVGGEVLFRSPVTFVGSATYLLSTNTFYTDNILELHSPEYLPDGLWATDDGKDIGLRFRYYANGTDTNAALVLANDTKLLEWYSSGAEGANVFSNGIYGGAKFGSVYIVDHTENTGTTATGALQVTGGVGIAGSLTVGSSATFLNNLLTVGNVTGDTVTADNLTVTNAVVYSDSTSTLQNTSVTWNALDQQLEGIITYANTSTNLIGGAYGSIPYQTGTGITAMLPIGADGTILTVASGIITWADAGGSTVGAATTATNLKGGSPGAIPFQSAPGVTSFDPEYFSYSNSGTTASLLTVVNIAITGTASSSTVSIDNALFVQGGAYIGDNIWTDGKVTIGSTESANFLGAGALATQGGAYIAKNVYVGSTSSSALSVEGGGSYVKPLTLLSADNGAPGFFPTGALIVQNGGIYLGQDLYAVGTVDGNLVRARNLNGDKIVLSDSTGQLYNGPLSFNTGTGVIEGTVTQANNLNGGNAGSIPFQSATSTTTFDSFNFYYSSQTLNVSVIAINSTTSAETTGSGALQVFGGASIADNLYVGTTATVGGDLYAANIYSNNDLVITTATINDYASQTAIFAGTDTAVSTSTGNITIWNTSTLETVTSRGATTNNAISITNDTASTSTTSGALTIAGGVGIGGDLYVGGNIYLDGIGLDTVYGTTGTFQDVISTGTVQANNLTVTNLTVTGISSIGGINLTSATAENLTVTNTLSVGNLITASNAVFTGTVSINGLTKVYNDTDSNAKDVGSIVTYGGMGVVKSVTVGEAITVGTTLAASPGSVVPAIYSNNVLLASYTSPVITGTSAVNLDTYSASNFRTARYTVQVVDGTKVHITEITIFHDGTNAYLNEYGTSTNQGELGVFSATLVSSQVTLTFDPVNATAMTIKVVRFGITN
jgi:hypothetical protein